MGYMNIWSNDELNYLMSHQELSDVQIGAKLNRTPYSVREKRRRIKHGLDFPGCNDDCFNCIYPDCLKPYRLF